MENDALPPALAPAAAPLVAPEIARLADEAREYVRQARAEATLRSYRADWADFCRFCALHDQPSLPAAPETLMLYLTDRARALRPATLNRRLAAISQAHQAAGYESPTHTPAVRAVFAGIRRARGVAQQGKAPAVTADIRAMVATFGDDLRGRRNRCLILLGFALAARRSELVGLDAGDVAETADGLIVTIRRSKTDQEGAGAQLGVPYGSDPATCPVRAYRAWRAAAGITDGALFRGVDRQGRLGPGRLCDRTVARVVKQAIRATGREEADFSSHSLRAGLCTAAAMAGVEERVIASQSRHKSAVVRRYIRLGSLFTQNAAARVGL